MPPKPAPEGKAIHCRPTSAVGMNSGRLWALARAADVLQATAAAWWQRCPVPPDSAERLEQAARKLGLRRPEAA